MKILGNFAVSMSSITLLRRDQSRTSLRIRFSEQLERHFAHRGMPPSDHLIPEKGEDGILGKILGYTPISAGNEYLDVALIGYVAQHPRQRIQPQLTNDSNTGIVMSCDYGRSVIALARPDSKLVFRHRHYEETVFYDGDRLVSNVKELEEQ